MRWSSSFGRSRRNSAPAIMLNEGARAGLIKAFEAASMRRRTRGARIPTSGPRARCSTSCRCFLPDSLAVKDLQDRLVARENDEIKRLS